MEANARIVQDIAMSRSWAPALVSIASRSDDRRVVPFTRLAT